MKDSDQLDEWVKGNPRHDHERGQCCPDFSCCTGKMASKDVRERFAKAYYENDKETQYQMLMMFLGNAFSDKKIYITGQGQRGRIQ